MTKEIAMTRTNEIATSGGRTFESRAVVLARSDIDTDQILPARFMVRLTFTGIETHAFADERTAYQSQGRVHPLDAPTATGAGILIAGPNFGCGSSREHAPQALHRRGFRYVIAPSFGEIFAANSETIGLVCVIAAPDDVATLQGLCREAPDSIVWVDVKRSVIGLGNREWGAGISERARTVSGPHADFLERACRSADQTAAVLASLPSCCSPNFHGAGM